MTRKRIATITYHNAINVGAVLQAYALQKYLETREVDTEIIDYRNRHVTNYNRIFHVVDYSIFGLVKTFVSIPIRVQVKWRFRKFTKMFKLTERIRSDDDLKKLNDNYDAFIVGSDQVWNPHHGGGIERRFFLDFVNDRKKKYSYAASFGFSVMPDELRDEYSVRLGDFNLISVREKSAIDIIRGLTGGTPSRSLDPVFLLPASEWRGLSKLPSTQRKYLLLFLVNGIKDELVQQAKIHAKERGLEVIFLSNTLRIVPGVRVVRGIGPREFLGYLIGAEAVFTDSFHGTAFSVMFNKEFHVSIVKQFGNRNNRSLELLDLVGIDGNGTLESDVNKNWDLVNERIAQARRDSETYLSKVIG